MATHLTVGARIYRPARLVEADGRLQIVLDSPSMKDFGDGTFMLRAAPLRGLSPRLAGGALGDDRRPGLRLRRAHPGRLDLF